MNPQMSRFFDALSDGIVLVTPAGMVSYANSVGMRLLGARPGEKFPDPRVVEAVKGAVASAQSAPLKISVGAGGLVAARQATISQLLPNTYVVSVQDVEEKAFYETTLSNFYEFLNVELAEPMNRFSRRVETMGEQEVPSPDDLKDLADAGKSIATRLARIRLLADVFKRAPLVAQERLPLADMVTDELSAASETIARKNINVYLNGIEQDLPPVYGSQVWLAAAFRELIANAVRHSASGSSLEIIIRCTGTHVVVCFRNHGQFASKSLQVHRVFVPFHQVVQLVKEKRMPANAFTGRKVELNEAQGPGLGLPICHQIADLHGGQLRIEESKDDGMVEISLELATGAPARNDQQLEIAQAQRYARDMAALMGRMKSAPKPGGLPGAAKAAPASPRTAR